jgi:membrane protease YdiL (CAAX protease family)
VKQGEAERVTLDDLLARRGEMTAGRVVLMLVPMTLGTALLLGYVVLRACNVRVFPRVRFRPGTWDPWHLGRCLIVYMVALRAVLGLVGWAQRHLGEGVSSTVLAAAAGNAVGIAVAVFLLAVLRERGGDALGRLGLREEHVGRRLATGVAGALMLQPVVLLAGIVTIVFGPLVGIEFRVQPLLFHARDVPGWAFAALCVSAVVVAPVTEEVLFRGFLYGALRRRWGPMGSICASAALFSVLHGHPAALLSLFAVGFLLAYLYERTGSLVAPMAAHALTNLNSMLMVLVMFRG